MRQAVRFIFNHKVGELSPVLENNANQFVVVGVTKISDGDYQSLEDVKQQLTMELINEQKAEKIVASINQYKPASLIQFSQKEGVGIDTTNYVQFAMNRITGIGEEPALIAAVSLAPVKQLSSPVKGKQGVYLFEVLSKTPSGEVFDLLREKMTWNNNNLYRVAYQSLEAVRKAYHVKDNRIRLY
jgi:peptidyl-prolyl cis-trans isomerase D